MLFSVFIDHNKAMNLKRFRSSGCSALFLFLFFAFIPSGRAGEIFSPTGLGLSAVFPKPDAGQIGGKSGLGSGILFTIHYKEKSNSFLNLGTGFYQISDDILKMDHFQTTVFPTIEIQYGKILGKDRFWHPNLYLGVSAYAAFDKIRIDSESSVSERYFQSSVFAGFGLGYQPNYMYSIHLNADYRYVFPASEHPERRYMMFWLGFLFYQ